MQTLRTLAARLAAAALLAGCSASSSQGSVADAGPEASTHVAAPRPVAPASASFVTSRRPTFRWKLGSGSSGARVEICAERACTRVTTTFDAQGSSASPPQDLPPGVVFWRLRGMSGASVGSSTSVTWELTVRSGSAPVSLTWGAMSDANGDGYGDVVAGDSDAFTKTQHVYVYLGGPSGPSLVASSVLGAPAPQLSYASSVASAGDVDGDGFPELLVGSPAENEVYVYAGGPSGWAEPPTTVLAGPTPDGGVGTTAFGQAVSGAGDVNGDGYADVVVGEPNRQATTASPVQGGAVVYFGSATGLSASHSVTLPTSSTSDEQNVGQFVASAGDVDGDGLADLAIYGGLGTTDPQKVLVFMGSATSFGTTPGIPLQFEGANTTWMGSANLLSCVGDVDGDGYPDLAMATATPPNAVYEVDHVSLFYGGATGLPPTPSRRLDSAIGTADHFGMSVAGGDFDQSGIDDVAIAVVSTATPPLVTQIYEGGPVDPSLTTTLTTTEGTLRYAREVGSADVDGDGYPDLIVGDPGRQVTVDGGVLHGAVLVFKGGPGGVASTPAIMLLPPDDTTVAFGSSIVRP